MTTAVHADVLDSALAVLSGMSDTIAALNAAPTNYADATGAAQLASAAMSTADFSLADTARGRSVNIAAKNAVVSATGSASHIVLLDSANSRILFTGTVPGTALVSGEVCQFLNWSISLNAA